VNFWESDWEAIYRPCLYSYKPLFLLVGREGIAESLKNNQLDCKTTPNGSIERKGVSPGVSNQWSPSERVDPTAWLQALEDADFSPYTLRVAAAFVAGGCQPVTSKKLAQITGVSIHTVDLIRRKLRNTGFLVGKRMRGYHAATYRIAIPESTRGLVDG
jgi:hypothetical protein